MHDKHIYEDVFSKRLSELRDNKGVSARDMSLSIGQNPGYINNIESGKALPSMSSFFYICEYLDVTPREFFDFDVHDPEEFQEITSNLKKLRADQINIISALIRNMIK